MKLKFHAWRGFRGAFSVGAVMAVLSGGAAAQTLAALFERALTNEPAYRAAASMRDAARARSGQALGALLPQLSLSANTHMNDREYLTRSAGAEAAQDRYNSNGGQLTLNQPLWRQANIAGLRQADAAAAQAEHQLAGAEMDLLAKLASAWFDLLAAKDAVVVSAQQVAATRRQWEVLQRGAELGHASPPQAEDARAKYDQALAESVAAETDQRIRQAAVEQLVGGRVVADLPLLRDDAVPPWPGAGGLEESLVALDAGNPAVRAALQAFEAAGHEVDKQRAGHLPTLDLVASYGKNSQATGGFPGQAGYEIKQNAIGLQLNVPIFSGGTQSAKVDEAVALQEKTRQDLEGARRAAQFALKQAWFGWHGAAARALAGSQGVRAAQMALQVARRGQETGLKTDLDVLLAEQQLAAARRDLRKARYDQLVTYFKLKAALGLATLQDVAGVDGLFVHKAPAPALDTPPPLPHPAVDMPPPLPLQRSGEPPARRA